MSDRTCLGAAVSQASGLPFRIGVKSWPVVKNEPEGLGPNGFACHVRRRSPSQHCRDTDGTG